MKIISGLASVVDIYDAVAIDQWGVLHDGNSLYPGVLDLLTELVERRKQVMVVTNSSRTQSDNLVRLEKLFGLRIGQHFDTLVSSAQLLASWLSSQPRAARKVHVIGGLPGAIDGDGTSHDVVPLEDCNMVALLGLPAGIKGEQWINVLLDAKKPVMVPNVDLHPVGSDGRVLGLGPTVARLLECDIHVRNFGKPARDFYVYSDSQWRSAPRKVLAIGDQLSADVVGASEFGWDTALVLTGAGASSLREPCDILPDFLLPKLCM